MQNNGHKLNFPENFLWGAGTAALQVEGFSEADGGGKSIWHTHYKKAGAIYAGASLDRACEHYVRFREDVRLMKELGLKAYRFSISWPRIFPNGDGTPNPKGLDFYQQLIDELLANGIEPWVTMFHWETPQALEERWGGWRDKRTAYALADYVAYVVPKISDRVKNFFTVNEIGCFTKGGYASGNTGFPPALSCSRKMVNQTVYNGCLAHGLVLQAIRATAKGEVHAGIADNPGAMIPLQPTAEDIAAARNAFADYASDILTLIMEGRFREKFLQKNGDDIPNFTDDELKVISTPQDFLGLNVYHGYEIAADSNSPDGYRMITKPDGFPRLDMPWLNVTPESAYWALRFANELWHPEEILISENGAACKDKIDINDGEIYDSDRILYLRCYLRAVHDAISEGIPVKGYFYWSFLDNLEWLWGEKKRFGLHYVNFNNQERRLKQSGKLYRQMIAENALLF